MAEKEKESRNDEQVKLEDLPVGDEQQDSVKGGLSVEDKVMSVM